MDSKTLSIIVTAQDQASKVFEQVGGSLKSFGNSMVDTGKSLDRYVTLPLVGVAAASVKMAGDFEQSLNILQSVTGASASQMTSLQKEAKDLGNDLTLPGISAKDAAGAMTELAKAGLSVNDVMSASKGVLSLAKAGQIDVSDAAMTTARALNAFGLKGTEANRIADLLAASANASTASVSDMALGLQMAGAQSHTMGISLQDTVTALAEFSNAGINGSDAGTSLKQMFMQLATPTKDAAGLMDTLGLKFFDAKGDFVGLAQMSQLLQDKLKNLTVEQKNNALATIFGSDASRVAAIMAQGGAAAFNEMSVAVNKQGAATDLAAAQNKGFNGALDNLKSTAETAMIQIGTNLLPMVTRELKKLTDQVAKVSDWFNSLSDGQKDFIFNTGMVIATVGPAILIMGKFATAIGSIMSVAGLASRAIGLAGMAGAATEATGAMVGSGGLLAALGPIGLVLGVAALAAGGAYLAYTKFKDAGIEATLATTGMYSPVSLLTLAQQEHKRATDEVTAAMAGVKTAGDNYKATVDGLKTSHDNLKVAQDSVKTAADTFGINSPQYQKAVGDLAAQQYNYDQQLQNEWGLSVSIQTAEDLLAKKRGELKTATEDLTGIQERLNRGLDSGNTIVANFGPNALAQVSSIDTLQVHIGSVVTAWSNWNGMLQSQLPNQISHLQGFTGDLNRLQGQADSVNAALQHTAQLQVGTGVGLQGSAGSLQGSLPRRAAGGPVTAGRAYVVGENEPEVFVPNTSGQILNQKQLKSGSDSGSIFNMYGTINLGSDGAVDRFFERLDAQKEMGALGVGV